MYTGYWWENLQKRQHLIDLGIDGSIISKQALQKLIRMIWLTIRTSEHGNKPLGP